VSKFGAALGNLEAYDVIPTNVSDLLTAAGSVDLINVSEAGILIALSVTISVATLGGTPTSVLEITIDGGTLRTIPLYTASLVWDQAGFAGFQHNSSINGQGQSANNSMSVFFHSRYASSLKVSHNVSVVADTTGTLELGLIRGKKIL